MIEVCEIINHDYFQNIFSYYNNINPKEWEFLEELVVAQVPKIFTIEILISLQISQ
jgi:hypothetical protein